MKNKIIKLVVLFLFVGGAAVARQIVNTCNANPVAEISCSEEAMGVTQDEVPLVIVPGNFMVTQ